MSGREASLAFISTLRHGDDKAAHCGFARVFPNSASDTDNRVAAQSLTVRSSPFHYFRLIIERRSSRGWD